MNKLRGWGTHTIDAHCFAYPASDSSRASRLCDELHRCRAVGVEADAETGKDVVGVSLMQKAFSPNKNLLRFGEHDQEQVGAMNIYGGVMAFVRNDAGHNIIDTYSQEDALRFVVFVDLHLGMVGKISDQQDTARFESAPF
jgi:hypothetical protein